jgi:hypothetical protein
VEDETNDILPDDPVKTSLMPSLLGGREGENEEEEEDFVDNEIETKIVTSGESSFAGQHDPNRFLHGQTDLNPAVLDTSCGPSTLLPVIPNAVVAKYGRCVSDCVFNLNVVCDWLFFKKKGVAMIHVLCRCCCRCCLGRLYKEYLHTGLDGLRRPSICWPR